MLPRCTAKAAQDLIMRRTAKRFLFCKNRSGKPACVRHPETRHHGSFDKEQANELPPAPAAKQKLEQARAFVAFYTSLTRLNVGILKDKVYPANM